MKKELLENDIMENLKDADCSKEQISHIMECFREKDQKKLLTLLKCQRCHLLDGLHDIQKKIDCLDYLIFVLKKEAKTK